MTHGSCGSDPVAELPSPLRRNTRDRHSFFSFLRTRRSSHFFDHPGCLPSQVTTCIIDDSNSGKHPSLLANRWALCCVGLGYNWAPVVSVARGLHLFEKLFLDFVAAVTIRILPSGVCHVYHTDQPHTTTKKIAREEKNLFIKGPMEKSHGR